MEGGLETPSAAGVPPGCPRPAVGLSPGSARLRLAWQLNSSLGGEMGWGAMVLWDGSAGRHGEQVEI